MRPEGLKNPYKSHPIKYVSPGDYWRIFEAGADAMLEGLKKEGKHTDTLPQGFHVNVDMKGYLVFIPEDKEWYEVNPTWYNIWDYILVSLWGIKFCKDDTKYKMSTQEKKQAFLDNYPKLLVIADTAKAIGIGRRSHYDWIEADEVYKAQFIQLKKEIDTLRLEENLVEVHRRGLEKSDFLLMFETKAWAPELYREKQESRQFIGDIKIIMSIPAYDETLREVKQLKEGDNG